MKPPRIVPGRHRWNLDDPCCTSCGEEMYLVNECTWSDIPAANVCTDCALAFVEQVLADKSRAGRRGGVGRARKLSAKRRSEIARMGGVAKSKKR